MDWVFKYSSLRFVLKGLKEEHKLSLFESRELRKIRGPKWGNFRRQ
jgi:hypothetical protein